MHIGKVARESFGHCLICNDFTDDGNSIDSNNGRLFKTSVETFLIESDFNVGQWYNLNELHSFKTSDSILTEFIDKSTNVLIDFM